MFQSIREWSYQLIAPQIKLAEGNGRRLDEFGPITDGHQLRDVSAFRYNANHLSVWKPDEAAASVMSAFL